MAFEIERRFLLNKLPPKLFNKSTIIQGYLLEKPVIRVRKKNNQSYLTIKNKAYGLVRKEWEIKIPNFVFIFLLFFCKSKISKIRFEYINQELIWEVDYFNSDLIIAEVEIPSADFNLKNPFESCLIKEVTNDPKYSNVYLSKNIKG